VGYLHGLFQIPLNEAACSSSSISLVHACSHNNAVLMRAKTLRIYFLGMFAVGCSLSSRIFCAQVPGGGGGYQCQSWWVLSFVACHLCVRLRARVPGINQSSMRACRSGLASSSATVPAYIYTGLWFLALFLSL